MGIIQLEPQPTEIKNLSYVRLPNPVVTAIFNKKEISATINFSKQKISFDDFAYDFAVYPNYKPRTIFQLPIKGSSAPAKAMGTCDQLLRIDFKSKEKSEAAKQREREESALKFHEQMLQEVGQVKDLQPSRVYKPPRQSRPKVIEHDPASADKYLENHPERVSRKISLRTRIIHLLALHRFMLEPICKILDEPSEEVRPILTQVAKEVDGIFRLREDLYIEVNVAKWPGYTHKDRIQVVKDCHTVFNLLRVPGNAPQRRLLDPYAEEACIIVDPTFGLSEEEIKALNSSQTKSEDSKPTSREPRQESSGNRPYSENTSSKPKEIKDTNHRPKIESVPSHRERITSHNHRVEEKEPEKVSRVPPRPTPPSKAESSHSITSRSNPIPLIKANVRPESNVSKKPTNPIVREKVLPRIPPQPSSSKYHPDPYSSSLEDEEMLFNSTRAPVIKIATKPVIPRSSNNGLDSHRVKLPAPNPSANYHRSNHDSIRNSTSMSQRDSGGSKDSSNLSRVISQSRPQPSRGLINNHGSISQSHRNPVSIESSREIPRIKTNEDKILSRRRPNDIPSEEAALARRKLPKVGITQTYTKPTERAKVYSKNSGLYRSLVAQLNTKFVAFEEMRKRFVDIQEKAKRLHSKMGEARGRHELEEGHAKAARFVKSDLALYYLEHKDEFKSMRDEVIALKARLLEFS